MLHTQWCQFVGTVEPVVLLQVLPRIYGKIEGYSVDLQLTLYESLSHLNGGLSDGVSWYMGYNWVVSHAEIAKYYIWLAMRSG